MLLILFLVLLVSVFLFIGVLIARSPGNPEPFVDDNGKPLTGSISEKTLINVNGIQQGMFIRGKDMTKPVLLFLHGGPGMTTYSIYRNYPAVLEEYFTVCYWDQRGAGLSYSSGIPSETMTVEQLIADAVEVTNYLRKRFGQEKIYLLGHSWGSFLGIQVAAKAPELYHAYIGMAQVSNQLQSEKLAYKYMVEQFRQAGDKRMLQKLEKYPIDTMDTLPDSYKNMRDEPMHKLGIGTTHEMKSVISGVFIPTWQSREYTFGEKVNIWRGKLFSQKYLWDKLIAADLTAKVPKLDIPVFLFHGKHDLTVNYTLAKDYLEKLQAPLKGFYTFEQSAHSPLYEEPEKAQLIIQNDVLAGAYSLADVKGGHHE